MEVTIPVASSDLTPYVGITVVAVILVIAFGIAASWLAYRENRAAKIVVALLLVAALGSAVFGIVNIRNHAITGSERADVIRTAFYEEYNLGDMRSASHPALAVFKRNLTSKSFACTESGPAPHDRLTVEVRWMGENTERQSGILANQGLIDGECVYTLTRR